MPSFTFVSTANAFVLRGGVPVFVDIRPDTLNIDETKIEAAITPRTKAIVPVHYAGVGCEMDAIMAIAERARSAGDRGCRAGNHVDLQGRPLGSIGHLGALSFHETKNIISGEGGALLVNDARFVERAEIIREKGTNRSQFFRGQVDKYTWVDIGSSYLPGEMIAAFLVGADGRGGQHHRTPVGDLECLPRRISARRRRRFVAPPDRAGRMPAQRAHVLHPLAGPAVRVRYSPLGGGV